MSFQETASELGGKNAVITAVDFSSHSEAALIWACHYAHLMKVPVIALHIVHEPADMPGFYSRDEKEPLRPLREVAETMMDEFLEHVRENNPKAPGIDRIQTLFIKGLPVDRILEASERLQASLLVMGSHGLTGLSHLLLGSNAEQVVQRSKIPVTILKMPESTSADE